jgi:hypothetical protein
VPSPLLTLLPALAAGPRCALEANAYLARLPAVAQLLPGGDPRLRAVSGGEGEPDQAVKPDQAVEAAQDIALLGAAFPVPQVRPSCSHVK